MAWEYDGRIGRALIGGQMLTGFTWMRDAEKGVIQFHAIPSRMTFDPKREGLPYLEQFIVPEKDFKPG